MEIQGLSLLDVVNEFGTPLYVYDEEKIKQQYSRMFNAFNIDKLKLNYASKALTNINILSLMNSLGAGIDTVSIQEIQLALEAGFAPENIVYTPNSVSIEEYKKAIKHGVKINIDNLELLQQIGLEFPELPICIRVNPHVMAGGHAKISVGHIDSKFGISVHQMPLVLRLVETLNLNIEGVHMHTGSDILDVEVFMYAADILFGIAKKFPDIQYIDFGSGFKVKYKDGDIDTDIERFGKEMSVRFNTFCRDLGRDITLMFEPGKYLVSEAGYFLVRANQIKQTTSTVFACVDSGFNHFIRPMFYNAHHDIINISNPNGNPRVYSVVGYICETDTFAWNRRINEIKAGDILLFKNAGAYCYQMSSNYNSRYRPAEVLIKDGKSHLIRERETFEDLLRKQVRLNVEA